MTRLYLKAQMDRSFLIQRLNKPKAVTNPIAFGGGIKNGGLSEKEMALLQGIFTFDYMGSTEFEWGAVPATLQFIAEQASVGNLISDEHRGVFYLAPASYKGGVKKVIEQLISDEQMMRLKEYCGLADALKAKNASEEPRILGWLELDNGYFFTISQEMAEKTKRLFQID